MGRWCWGDGSSRSARERVAQPSAFPFHELDNVLMTPHLSAYTEGTLDARFRTIAQNIGRLARGEKLENQVHP